MPDTRWYPAALFILGLLVVCVYALPRPRPSRAAVAAVALLAAYGAWSLLSIVWADQDAQAWDGGNRAVLYAAVFAIVALGPMRGWPATVLIAAFGLGVAGIGLVELLRAAASDDALQFFIDARFAEPLGYQNAAVAFWTMGLIACVFTASRREIVAPVRGLALAGAGLLAGLALMGGSRGWLFSIPVALALFVAITPGRVRLLASLAAVGAGLLVMRGPVLDVYDKHEFGGRLGQPGGQEMEPLIRDARGSMLVVALVLLLLGTAVAMLDRHSEIPPRVQRRGGIAVLVAVAVLGVGALGAWFVAGDPAGQVSEAWDEFKAGQAERGELRSRFSGGLGSNRYDFWRVAWDQFEEAPLVGAGVDNYQQEYLLRGRSEEEPDHPHSLPLKVLSQTGLVGALILLGAFAAALWAALRTAFRRRGRRGAAGAATAIFLYWFVHGALDWFWEFPALGIAAFAFLGLAVSLASEPEGDRAPASLLESRAAVLAARGVFAAVAVACAVSFALPWLAARNADLAVGVWRDDPAEAFDLLDRAASLNPFSTEGDILAAGVALRIREPDRATAHFRAVLDRDPRSSYAHMQLGALASQRGDRAEALRLLRRAVDLTPRDRIKRFALREVRARHRVDPLELDELITTRVIRRVGEDKR